MSPIKAQVHLSHITENVVVSPKNFTVILVLKCGCYPRLLCVNLTTFKTLKQHRTKIFCSCVNKYNSHYVFLTELDNLTVLFENSTLKSLLFINKATQES